MGANVSKSTSSVVNEAISNVMSKNSLDCSGDAVQNVTLKLSKIKAGRDANISGIEQDATQVINLSCMQESSTQATLKTDVADEINKQLDQKISGVNFGSANVSENITDIKNKITTNVDIENIVTCAVSAFQDLDAVFSEIQAGRDVNISNIHQVAMQTVVSKCTQKNTELVQAMNELDTLISEKTSQSVVGLDPFGMLQALGQTWSIVVGVVFALCICCCCISVISSVFRSGGSSSDNSSNPPSSSSPYGNPYGNPYASSPYASSPYASPQQIQQIQQPMAYAPSNPYISSQNPGNYQPPINIYTH